eukprot:2352021-Prymnesium_polylepis.1
MARAPRRDGSIGCRSLVEVDPYWNYDYATKRFVKSATALVQKYAARDMLGDSSASEHSVQWINGSTVSNTAMKEAYEVPSDDILIESYKRFAEVLAATISRCGKIVIVESKLQVLQVLSAIRAGRLIVLWDFLKPYEQLCEEVEKVPALRLMKVEIAMVAVLPSRKTEPFSLISTSSIATHIKGMFVRPLYRSLALHYYHRKIRLVRFLRELSSTSQLPMYKDSNLKSHFDQFIYDAAQISCLTEPDPDEVEAMRASCRKGGLGGAAFFSMKLSAEALDQMCCDESIVIYVERGATGEDGL